jgi:hypothetical protein
MRQRQFDFAKPKRKRRRRPDERGPGRPRVLPGKPRLPHRVRERIPARLPVHVTLRLEAGLPSMRQQAAGSAVMRAIWKAQQRFAMRVTHFVVESNHVHLIAEGVSARGMKGLGVRIARAVNKLARRRGRVIGDTYHARGLRTKTEVRNAIHYVLNNHQRHSGRKLALDSYTSLAQPDVVVRPRTWLLLNAWRSRPPP